MSEVEVTSNNLLKTAAGVIPHEYGIREDGVRWTAYRPYIAPARGSNTSTFSRWAASTVLLAASSAGFP